MSVKSIFHYLLFLFSLILNCKLNKKHKILRCYNTKTKLNLKLGKYYLHSELMKVHWNIHEFKLINPINYCLKIRPLILRQIYVNKTATQH